MNISNQIELSIIIPFLNEKENLPHLVSELNIYVSKLNINTEVVFVDDGSTDGSVNLLKELPHTSYNAQIISLSKNFGSINALRAGVSVAKGNLITFLYADLQDPPELLIALYNKLKEGFDIVWAARRPQKIDWRNRFFSRLYAWLMKKYVFKNFPPNGFDVVLFNHKIKKELNDRPESNSSIFLQILSFGFLQSYIEYDKQERKHGKSKWTLAKKLKLVIDSFVAFSFMPIRLVSTIGILMTLVGIIYLLYIIIRVLVLNDLPLGWPTVISIILIGFGVTNISLGIIAEYLWRTLDASRNRKPFIIHEIINLPNNK
jgi:dolichol-phosphate mannosyltransferase